MTDVDTTWREIGRIRTGQRGTDAAGTPRSLVTFRLTSASETAVRAAALAYGGETRRWQSPAGPAWEVVTEAAQLDVAIPPGSVFSQWWERWTAAGRERQCDGHYDRQGERPCVCPAELDQRQADAKRGRACRPITRLALILPRLPDLGVWRLEVHGIIAARELGATMRAVTAATDAGHYVPGVLRLEQRQTRRPGEKPHDYGIPVLELPELRAQDLLPGDPERMQLALGGQWRRHDEPPLLEALIDAPDEPVTVVAATRAQAALVYETTAQALDATLPIPTGGTLVISERQAETIVDVVLPETPYLGEELEHRIAELHALGAEHRLTPFQAEEALAREAGLEADASVTAQASRRAWARTLLRLHAGDYDLSPLERATLRAAQATADQSARDPRSGQVPPDPAEVGQSAGGEAGVRTPAPPPSSDQP